LGKLEGGGLRLEVEVRGGSGMRMEVRGWRVEAEGEKV
jgi:hypothetical protein